MFRINHLLRLSNLANKTIISSSIQPQARLYLGLQTIGASNRLYSKDAGPKKPPSDPSKKLDDKNIKACPKDADPPKLKLKECKPVDIHPCQPPPPPVPAPKIPYLNECAKPDLTSECPQPQCPYEEDDPQNPYKNAIILGLLIAAATLGALYAIGFFSSKDDKPKPKEQKKKKKRQKRAIIKDPPTSADIPKEVPYLLIGGGTASFSAFRAIKSEDPTAKVLVITDESFHPYMRPPLSKEMWFNDDKESVRKLIFKQWNGSERNLYYEPEDFYIKCKNLLTSENGGVAVARGFTVSRIDVLEKIAYLDDGYAINYDKCLIATGATPKTLPVFEAACTDPCIDEKVKLFRNIYDFEDIYETFDESKAIAIVGGGFLGSELACALARKAKKSKKEIYQIFREGGNMGKVLPEYLSEWTMRKVTSEGVQVLSGTEVVGVKSDEKQIGLILSNGKTIKVDQVIVAVGVEPNTALAEQSNLEVDPDLGGFLVNTELLARSDLYIAGDCACFYDAKLGRRRIEHHDHAVVTGRLAGENMTGKARPYLHQSMFWSDLGPDVGYEAIGIIDSSLPTVAVFAKSADKDKKETVVTETDSSNKKSNGDDKKALDVGHGDSKTAKEEDYNKGIIFYLRDDVVVGVVLWNVFNRMSIARQVLKDERKYEDLNEVAKLFNIHEE